jgi:hypothetical protein
VESSVFRALIRQTAADFIDRWLETPADDLQLRDRYSPRQKVEREKEFELLLQKAPSSREEYDRLSKDDRARLRARVRGMLGRALSSPGNTGATQFFDDCEHAGDALIQQAGEFDPGLSENDIHQALRNLWVFNSIQKTLGLSVVITPSSFAYSLLYPYTDNWLDAQDHSGAERASLVRWLTDRLEGLDPEVFDRRTEILARLLGSIDHEYPRSTFPDVHSSLLAIHQAQRRALSLHEAAPGKDETVLLPLTFEKGGTSVLVDGFLVGGHLTPVQMEILFGYGVVLQLIDDLQDLDEDRASGHSTVFARAAMEGALEKATTRLINYTQTVLARLGDCSQEGMGQLEKVIGRSCFALIVEAVSRYSSLYSKNYLASIEEFVPVSLPYLRGLRKRMETNYRGAGGG